MSQALSEFADYAEKWQAHRRPPGQPPATFEEHDELDILDQLGLSDEASTRTPIRTLLLGPAEENEAALAEHLRARLDEGHGEALFDVGLDEKGDLGFSKEEWDSALERMRKVCDDVKADYKILMTRNVGGEVEVGPANLKDKGASGKLLLRRRPQSVDDVIETRIAVVGNGRLLPTRSQGSLLTCRSRCR
jgi:hypothetical protein